METKIIENDPLAQLSQEAATVEAGDAAAASQDQAIAAAPVDTAKEWRDAVAMGCGLIVAAYPELKSEWTKETYDNLGNALDKCALRYGWTVSEVLGHPLLALAVASWPLAASLSRVVKARAAQNNVKKPAAAGEIKIEAGASPSVNAGVH